MDFKHNANLATEYLCEINETQKKEDTHFKKLALTNRK
jgi:hypothetical protein